MMKSNDAFSRRRYFRWCCGFAIAPLLFLSGCSVLNDAASSHAKQTLEKELVFAKAETFGRQLSVTQQVDVSVDSHQFSLIQQTEIRKEEIAIAGLSHFGSPLYTVQYIGQHLLTEKMPALPDTFHVPLVLRDFQFAFWPVAELVPRYHELGFRIVQTEKQRTLFLDDDKVITVNYQYADRMLGAVEFYHHELGYRVNFHTVDIQRMEE